MNRRDPAHRDDLRGRARNTVTIYTSILGVPANVLSLLVLYSLAWAYLNFTKGGRTVYAIGSNRE
jgi:ribose/xylose/arabinose/galactoside ABC-type transport system permease subunit